MPHTAMKNDHGSQVVEVRTSRLDATVAPELKHEILSSIDTTKSGTLIIDLGHVEFMDSSGVGALVSVRKQLPENAQVELRNLSQFVRKVLMLTRMDRVFHF